MRTWNLRILGQISILTLSLLHLLTAATLAIFKSRTALQLENLALRHQPGFLRRSVKRSKLIIADRLLWAWLSEVWATGGPVCSSSSPKQSLAGAARVFGCSGPGKFAVAGLEDQRLRRMCVN